VRSDPGSIGRIERCLLSKNVETLQFKPGVNLLVGPPNTGKTMWLRTLDYLLGGDSNDNPYGSANEEEGLAQKYDVARVELFIDGEQIWLERRWQEPGAKTKIFVKIRGQFSHFTFMVIN